MISRFPSSFDRIISVSLWLPYSFWSQGYLWMCWQNRLKTSEISMRMCPRLGSLGSRLCRLLSRWFIGKAFGMDSNGRKRKEAGMSRVTSRALMQSQRKTQMGWNLGWGSYRVIVLVCSLTKRTWEFRLLCIILSTFDTLVFIFVMLVVWSSRSLLLSFALP